MQIGRERFDPTRSALALASAALIASCSFDSSPQVPSQALPRASVAGIGGHGSSSKDRTAVVDAGPGGDAGDASMGSGGKGSAGSGGKGSAGSGGKGSAGGGGNGSAGTGGGTVTSFCKDPTHDGMDCDDGFFCTTGEHCADRLCKSGKLTSCASMDDPCNIGVCDVANDVCAKMPAKENQACDDGAFCTTGEACHAGECNGGQDRVCPAFDADCGTSVCDEENQTCTIVAINEGQACDDGQSCSTGETCRGGRCTATWCPARTQCVLGCPAQCNCDVQCADAARCETTCAASSKCTTDCLGVDDCASDCAAAATCDIDCTGSGKCETNCRAGSTCDVVCASATRCLLSCAVNATCDVDCRDGSIDCTQIACAAGAHCLLRCGDNKTCGFMGSNPCPGGAVMECDGGVLVCGRDCPPA